jgi:hypothetical protein
MPDDYDRRGISASSLYNYPRLSENVSHAPLLTGSNFLLAQLDPRAHWWRDVGPFETTGPLHPMDWADSRFPQPNYAQPEEAPSAFTLGEQMRMAPFLEETGRLLDDPERPPKLYANRLTPRWM